jgi:hypothetical protein
MKRQLVIANNKYVTAAELVQLLGISRQTLWRWRQSAKIPLGSIYQDRLLVFTEEEAAQIRDFAERIIPAGTPQPPSRSRSRE